jgi:O-antigen biosynthesis protein
VNAAADPRHVALLESSGLFDRDWYLGRNPDVAAAAIDPLLHYLTTGAGEGRDPGPRFETEWYLEHNPDVRAAGMNPLLHYVVSGAAEGRAACRPVDPAPAAGPAPAPPPAVALDPRLESSELFDREWYLEQNPDVAAAGIDPLLHYATTGFKEGRDPSPRFDASSYLEMYPDVRVAGVNPLLHYLTSGAAEGRAARVLGPLRLAPPLLPGSASSRARAFRWLPATPPNPRRILVVDARTPTPDRDAGSLRMCNLLKILRERGYAVTYVGRDVTPVPEHELLASRLAARVVVGRAAAIAHLEEHGCEYRFVILSRAEIAYDLLPAVRAHALHATVIYDTVDLHWLRTDRMAEVTDDARLRAFSEQRRAMERSTAAAADLVFVVTERERELLTAEVPEARVEVVPTVHAACAAPPPFHARRDLVFVGGFKHDPNVDAVVWFAERILPLVRRRLPDVVVDVVGWDPPEEVRRLASPAVRVVGHVPRLEPLLDERRISVAPLRFGGGMKGKVAEAMSRGLPVVTTPAGAEGMDLRDGESALVAGSPEGFAAAVVRLYTDEALWTRIADRGRRQSEERFSPAVVGARLDAILGGPLGACVTTVRP